MAQGSMVKRKQSDILLRGGIRQRLAAEAISSIVSSSGDGLPPSHKEGIDSELVAHLLFEWSWGKLSATGVQAIAHKAYADQLMLLSSLRLSIDLASASLKRMSGLGTHGKHQQNCHTELLNYLGEPSTPAPFVCAVPLLCQKTSHADAEVHRDVEMSFFLPHVIFSHYYHNNRTRFNELFLCEYISPAKMHGFWQELLSRGDPRLVAHPMRKQSNWMRTVIPISFHGDGVPVLQVGKANAKSLEVYSIQSIFNSTSSTLKAKVLMTMVFNQNLKDESHTAIWTVLNWSLHWLYEGLWPRVDLHGNRWPPSSSEAMMAGQPLAQGLRCAVWSIKGDLDFFAKTLKLQHYNSNSMCDLCPANRGPDRSMMYNNFSSDAAWMTRLRSTAEWKALYPGGTPHPIFTLVGVNHHSLEPDELHLMYLGTVQYFLGSVLYLLVFRLMSGTPESNMSSIWVHVSNIYRAHSVANQYSTLTISSFAGADKPHETYPKLEGKGAEVKDLVFPLSEIWANEVDRDSEFYKPVRQAFLAQLDLQGILHDFREEILLPVDAAASLRNNINSFLLTYQKLAAGADASGDVLWNQPTKFHWLWHMGQKAFYVNPRRSNTMLDEDFVGKMKVVAHACAAGAELHVVPSKACAKYRWGFHFLGLR